MTVFAPPPAVLRIAKTLESAGFEAWCVGGAVRDALLGHRHLDWDIATSARPPKIRELFPRTVPVGILFGTVGVLDENGIMHEVTTFRRDVHTDGRHAVVEFGATLDEDLARRDYTINAIAYSPSSREIRDPFEGRRDLEKRVVRAVGDPEERMREDRLRALRAIRFGSRFGFEIEPATWNAIVGSSQHLGRLSAERVKQEIEKTMDQVLRPSEAFALWKKSGAFAQLVPSLAEIRDVELETIDHLALPGPASKPGRQITRLIALFLAAPPKTLLATLKGLRFSNSDAAWIAAAATHWNAMSAEMRFAMIATDPPADAVLRRWAAMTGRTRLAPVLRVAGARWAAERDAGVDAPSGERVASVYRRAVKIAYRDPIEVSDLAVSGSDLERIGLTGPSVGKMLRRLLETVINDPAVNSRDKLLAIATETRGDARAGKD